MLGIESNRTVVVQVSPGDANAVEFGANESNSAHPSIMNGMAKIFQVDAFTTRPYCGNPATVVLGAEGAPDQAFAAIAREFSHAETVFVMPPAGCDHDVQLRFFNAHKEAPFVGHATIAAHAVLLAEGTRQPGVLRQLSGGGVIEVKAESLITGPRIEFRQTAPDLGLALAANDVRRVAQALGVSPTDLHQTLPARIARKGSTRLLLPLAAPGGLNTLSPRFDALVALGNELGCEGFFVFGLDRTESRLLTHSRMFCPAIGIPEDPVSGNAHAMLAAYLWEQQQIEQRAGSFLGLQGRHMGRAGQVEVRLEIHAGKMTAASIAGNAVIVSRGELHLPDL
jgi:PhzF family phenazine biosynthesis protein